MYPECLNTIQLEIAEPFISSNTKHLIRCLWCGNTFMATPKSKMANAKRTGLHGCPKCTIDQRFAADKANIREALKNLGFEIKEDFRSKLEYVTARNTNCPCGRWWKTKPEYLKSGRSFCRPCNDDKKRTRFDQINKDRELVYDGTIKKYKAIVTSITEKNYKQYKDIINPSDLPRTRSNVDGYQLDHIVPVVTCFRNGVPAELCADISNLRMVRRMDNAKKWSKPTESIPPKLRKYFNQEELIHSKIRDNLDASDVNYQEYFKCGDITYNFKVGDTLVALWSFNMHKEQSLKSKGYILEVRKTAIANGYRPIIVFEHEVTCQKKFAITASRILNATGNSQRKIYARNCIVREVGVTEKGKFLKANHIQGPCGSTNNYGLWYKDELIAIMTFSPLRKFIKGGGTGEYELIRFATKLGTSVIGGASKLFKYFVRTAKPVSVMSFSDNRWGSGNVYAVLGMTKRRETKQNYWYIVDGEMHHRYAYAKHFLQNKLDLYDPNLSEYQNMLMNGHDRVWDCGSSVYMISFVI